MANENMTALWGKLTESGLKNKSLSDFEADMNDYNNRYTLWENLSKHPKYNKTFEEFTSDMGIVSNEQTEQTEQTETPAPLIQEEPQQKSSNSIYWQSIGAHNPYPTIQKPDKEVKMSEVVRPKDYTGQSNDGSIESLLSSSFYNLSDEELSSQMKQLQKELDAPMEPVYSAFKAQTGREYDRSGKNNSNGDEIRLESILNSMKAAELTKRGYYDANSSMRRAKIKKEVDDLFDDNSGNGKEIKERLSRLSAEKAWRERQGTGKQVMLGKALSEQQKEIQRLQESGPTNISLSGAQKYLDDAIAEYNAPSKYGPENGFVNWAGGLGSQLSNYDTWTAGVTEMARAIDLKNIVEKMNTGESLPPAEQAKLDAFLLYNLVQESRQEDISNAYSIGKGTAESIPFMAEMFITAGIGAAGKKLILKSLLKKGNKEAAEKIARIFGDKIDDIVEDKAKKEVTDFALKEAKQGAIERSARQIGQDVAMTAAMPTTWTAISEDKVNKILNGEEYGFKDFLRTFAGQAVGTGTEHWGGKIVDKALGSVMPLDKIWGKTRWGKIFTNDFIQSPLGETGEEYVGAAVNYIRSLNPMYSEKSNEELRAEAEHMFSPEGFTQTFLTVLPMSVLGGAGNIISHRKTINTYRKSKSNLISMLTELGATNEQAQTIFTSIEGSSDTQGFTEKLQYMVGALKTQYQEQHPNASLEETEEYFNKLDKVVGDYYRSAYYLNELGGEIQSAIDNMDETEKQQVKQDFENEVKQQITNPSTTEDSDKNLEVLSTGNKPIEFKINVTEETRESGKTSDVTKEVKVSFRSNAYSYDNDGSIISDKFSLLANGSPLSGKKKEEYFGLINDQLRAEKAKADEKTAKEREAQAQLEQEREAQAQQIAQQKAAAEQKKKQLRETTPMKEGVVDTESSKATPAHVFLWNLDNHGQEEAIKRAARVVGESIYAKEKLEEDTKMSSTKRDAEIDRANMRIAAYEQAVKDFVGETAAQQLRQDAEGQVALLLQRDMENAKEEERARLERIAEKQRIKEENRKLYRTNLDNPKENSNFAQNSNDNGNNEGTNRELQEGSGSGVLGTAWNGQTQSGGNRQGNEGVPSSDGLGDNQRNQGGDRAGLLSTHPDDIIDVERDANNAVHDLLQKYGLTYSKHRVFQVTGELFRQTILQEKSKNPKGWMVSVHPLESDEYEVGYNDCKCYLTADGLSGVAVTPTGDIISLFSSVSKDHRMEKLIAWALTHGGKKADCYANGLQRLYARFGGKVVSQTPFVDKWAPEDWDGESRGQVVFLTFPTVEEALQTYADYEKQGIKLPEVDLSEDVVRDFPDEDNGYNQAGEYRDKVLSGEITQEKETTKEESTSQEKDTPKEVQQEPIDLTANNVVMMVQGKSSTRTTYTFARHEIDEDGNDVYINLGCPFGSKAINGNIGRKLSTKTWAVTDKSKKLFYVKDAYGTPFACYAITSEDISNKKFLRGSKLNAVVAKTGESLSGVTSMQDAYIMQRDKEVSILKDKKQHGNKIKAESIESLLKHKVVIRFASEAKGEKEISVTLYDLLYGEFASDVNNFAKAREFTNVEAENSGYRAGLYTGLLKDAIMDMAKAWNEYCSNNGLKNIKPDLSKLSQQDRDLFWFARQEMNRENREEADKASMEVQTSVPAKTMGDSNGIYNNPLHQLGVMLYIANKLGYVQGEVFNNLPGSVKKISERKHIVTKDIVEKVRERYNALKSGKATVNLDKFETEKQEMEYYEKYYPEVLNDEPAHNRLAITDDNSRKKSLRNIHDSKLREEAAKEVAKEEKKETPKDKSEKEPAAKKKESSPKEGSTSVLDEIITNGFELLDKAIADNDQAKQEEVIQQLNILISGNAAYQDRLAKMLADAEAKKIRAEVLKKKIAEQEKAKSETKEIDENSYNAVDAISEEVPAPSKRRKKNRQPVQVEAEKVENTLEAAPIQEAVAEPDVASETESTEEQPITVEAVEETAAQDDTNVTFDASSLNGKSEKELKDRQSDLYLKDELQGLTKEEELELDAIKERLGGAKVYKGYEGTKQSDRNKGMSNDLAFSVSPQQRAQTARSRVLGEMMMRVLGRIKGLNVHMVGSQSEAHRVLQELNGIIEFDGRIKKDWNSTIASLDAACRKLLLAGPVGLSQSKSGAKVQNISDIRNSLEKLSQTLSENDAFSPEEFIRQLANALNIKDVDSKKTNYQNIKLENGAIISIRNSGHQANALSFILKNNNNIINIGVVTKYNKELKSVKKDGKKQRTHRFQGNNSVNYVEFVYFADKTDTAARQKAIVDGVISFLNTESLSGIAKPDRVNVSGKFKDELKITSVEIEQFKAPNGTIYGFAVGNDIYITPDGMNANTPIHEYTHLWAKALQSSDPKAWKKIVGELKKNKALWESVTKDEAYKDLDGDDAIASEVFARYVGDKGEALLEELAKKQKFGNEKLEEAFINRVKRSLRGFWEKILNLLVKPFGLKYNFKPKNIDEFANLTLRDLFDGKELNIEDARIDEEIESIKQKAIDNGTFMKAPNGQQSNLPEKLWLLVRTKNFKNWFGDWENDPLRASKVVDENGEPMVVYHGTGSAGFETFRLHSESDANTGSRGFFTTENRRVASTYTRDSWTETHSNAQDVILGADPHEAVYSLFMNMRNPMVVDFADEDGNKRHWNEYPTNRWVVAGDEQLGMEDAEFSSEEEANEYLSQFGSSDKPIHVMLTTDDFLRKASEVGFDGCIFKNVYDGNYTIGEEMTDYVALSPNQLKSTNNKGYFSTIDDRIEYQYAEDELTQLDEHAEELIREQEKKGNAIQLDPDLSGQERESWWESIVTRVMDQSNGMRLMLDSINAYRKMKGLEPLDGDKYDVRTKFEACNSIIANKVGFLERGIQQELDDTIREFAKVVEDSQFYKDHKKEVGGENPTTLTPVEFIERYLIARNNWERAKEGKPRGIAEFKDRMGMGVIEFSNAFTEAYGEKVVLNLWDKIRQMTDFALDTNLEGGLISEEMHAELKAKKFYVPQRGFWDDVNGENDRENEEDILKRRTRGSRTAQNKLDSMHKAEGGKSLAEGCLAYIARDARQAIKLSEENKVKKVMFDLLRDNEDWCHEPEHGFRVPRQAFFYTDENGDIQMMDDGPTPEQVQEMRELKRIVKQLRQKYKDATTEQEREEIAAEIEETESLYPYFDEKDSWRIMHSRVSSQYDKNGLRKNKDAKKAKAIVGLYINGVPCEIEMTPRFVRVADALNGRRDMTGEFSAIKSVTSWLSAQYTINNPTFFAVNITRDTPYIITKGATEYGPEFSLRFTANWAASQKAVWKYLITGEIDDTDIGAQLLDFLNNGGNTGYSNLEELQKFRNHVKDLNPGGLERLQRELSTVEGASKVGKVLLASVGKGTIKFGDKLLGWAELRPLAQVLNEWSEIISRFSAYKSVVDMGLGVNEGVKAAHNLSTNFNRKGLGAPVTNLFNSLSVFANAGIQGASGYWRTLKSNDGKALKKIAKTAAYMGMMPAFLGFLSTMLSPDDDDKEYAPSQYERDNYIVIGDIRIALNEQLKPWWCIGVNIAQLLRGRRTLKQATNSVVTSVITNWLPVAQNIKEPISMMVDNATSQEEWNIAQIARTAIMPSAMQSLNQWADNKNFLGGKLRYDIGDIPEYEMAPNEAALYQDLARALYVFGGGNEKVPSKTKDDGTKLRKLWDVNPKEIRSNLFWIPSGALDMFCLGYGIYKDTKEKIEGDYKGTNVRVKDLPIINRFYKPNDNTLYRYAIVREVRAMVKQHNDRIRNLKKQTIHFNDVFNKTGDISAFESIIETNMLYYSELNDVVYTMLSEILGEYNNISIRSLQNELGESKKEVELYHGEAVGKMNLSEQELVQLMLQGLNTKKGLKHSKDVPEWIEWFDEHSPSQKESIEE